MCPSNTLQEALDSTRQVAVLAVVPFLVALMRWHDLVVTGADTTTRFSVTFPTPHSFISLWSFVNAPTETGSGIGSGSLPLLVEVGLGALFGVSLLGYVILAGLALAGYLGSIADGVADGSFDFLANVRRYARPLVAYEALSVLVLLAFVGGLVWFPAVFPIVAIGVFVVAYLTYLTPYLVVVADVGLVEALRRSVRLTTQRFEAGIAFVGFVVLGAVVSVPVSLLAHGNGAVGGVLAAALTAPLGLFASVAFVLITRDLSGVTTHSSPT